MYKKLLYLFVIMSLSVTAAFSQEAELVHLWQFDGDTEDASGSGNHGEIDGPATYVPGQFGQAISLDAGIGVTNMAPANIPIGATDTWSMNIWLKLDETPANLAWLAGFGGRPVHAGDGSKRAYLQFDAGYYFWGHSRDVDSGQAYTTDGIWHMYTITYDGADIVMYFDAAEVKRQATTLVDTQAVVGVGGTSHWAADLVGKYDDFSIWRGVLSLDGIERLMSEPTLGPPALASAPIPENDASDVLREVILAWTPGEFAVKHNVYLGMVFDDVNEANLASPLDTLVSQGQAAGPLDVGFLEYGQTYYWRVDEVNAAPDNTVFKGKVWNFTVEPYSIPIETIAATASSSNSDDMGPEKTIDGSGLNELDQHSTEGTDMWLSATGDQDVWIQYEFDKAYKLHEMWVWNSNQLVEAFVGLGVKDVTIEVSTDGAEWTQLEGVSPFAQAPGADAYSANTVVDIAGAMAKYVKINTNSAHGPLGQYGLSELRFFHIPTLAREAKPDDGSTVSGVDVVLNWRAGREAVSHQAYLGTSATDLALIATTHENTFATDMLSYDTVYYWQIVEVNEAEAPSSHASDIWSFTTPAYALIDDFETHDDDCKRIFFAWADGLGHNGSEDCGINPNNGNGTGSIVGHAQSPFAEQSIVYSGTQSLPLGYDNSAGPSEAVLTLDGQNWDASGVNTLTLMFHGAADNSGQLYLKRNKPKIVHDGPSTAIGKSLWHPWNIDLSSMTGDLQNVTELTIGIEGANAAGTLYVDNIRLYPQAAEVITPTEPDNTELLAHYKFNGDATDSAGNGFNGEENGGPAYGDGVDGQAMEFDGADDYVNVVLDVPENGCAVAFWFKTTNPDCGLYAVVQNALGDGGHDRHIYLANGDIRIRIYSGEVITGAGTNAADGQWHHVVHTYGDAIGGQKLYVDGILQASGTKAQSDFDWQERVHLGWSADAGNPYMEGALDDLRIYNRTLTPEEAAWLAGRTTEMHKPF